MKTTWPEFSLNNLETPKREFFEERHIQMNLLTLAFYFINCHVKSHLQSKPGPGMFGSGNAARRFRVDKEEKNETFTFHVTSHECNCELCSQELDLMDKWENLKIKYLKSEKIEILSNTSDIHRDIIKRKDMSACLYWKFSEITDKIEKFWSPSLFLMNVGYI